MVLCCLFFGVGVSMMFHFMFVNIISSLVLVAEWPPFGKELLNRMFSLYFDYL